MEIDPEILHRALVEANRGRAHLYLAFLRAIQGRWGRDTALSVMREAIRSWGRAQGETLAERVGGRFEALLDSFIFAPDGGRMFAPEVRRCDSKGLDAEMMDCPLKTAWQEAGLLPDETALLCNVACEADHGVLEGAGFSVEIDSWRPGSPGCCSLRIRKSDSSVR
jgi:L-2-amino-thiazoline-4-carboxylic acid hydrolase